MFIDLGTELYQGLEIIDPALATCCDALYVSKFGFLSEMSTSMKWDHSEETGKVVIKLPRRTVEIPVLENVYAVSLAALQSGDEKAYWPDTWTPAGGAGLAMGG